MSSFASTLSPSPPLATFLAPSSFIEPSFWEDLYRLKLDVQKLDAPETPVLAYALPSAGGRGPCLTLTRTSFLQASTTTTSSSERAGRGRGVALRGTLINVNTIEEFKAYDKKGLLDTLAGNMYRYLTSAAATTRKKGLGSSDDTPSSSSSPSAVALDVAALFPFVVLSFADLKAFTFTYWVGVPAITQPIAHCFACTPAVTLAKSDRHSLRDVYAAVAAYNNSCSSHDEEGQSSSAATRALVMMYVKGEDGTWVVSNDMSPLKLMKCFDPTSVALLVYDSGCEGALGWHCRNVLSMLSILLSMEEKEDAAAPAATKEVSLVLLRGKGAQRLAQGASSQREEECSEAQDESLVCSVAFVHKQRQQAAGEAIAVAAVGWESGENGRPAPRVSDMRGVLDSRQLMAQAVDLNLKLMKWRLWPELEVDALSSKKCLLLGAGTLGCAVARALVGWGVRSVTLVDSGRVSYSNPTRQCLFSFEDGARGLPKAEAAAAALRAIFPDMRAEGRVLSIPMPGHPFAGSDEEERAVLAELDGLVRSSDVVFLLTDSREARWLPTVMCAYHDKIAINAALGFDTYLVMRHGHCDTFSAAGISSSGRLGCYFCNDIVAATNSQRDRSLDQQCTVTRPGLSYIAAALAVELMVALLQSPLQQRQPAPAATSSPSSSAEGGAGDSCVPHQIRGGVRSFGQRLLSTACFDCCTACGARVLEEFHRDPFAFVKKVCADSRVLEDISGITALTAGLDVDASFEMDSDEDE